MIQKYKTDYQQAHPPVEDAAAVLTGGIGVATSRNLRQNAVAKGLEGGGSLNATPNFTPSRQRGSKFRTSWISWPVHSGNSRRPAAVSNRCRWNPVLSVTGRLRVISDGSLPDGPSSDTHFAMAAAGGGAGLLLSVLFAGILALRKWRKAHLPLG